MRFLVFSDSHGRWEAMKKIIAAQTMLDGVFHLGDGQREVCMLQKQFPQLQWFCAVGNCDSEEDVPYKTVTLGGVSILYTHGHRLYVKHSDDLLFQRAQEESASIALFGHTHRQTLTYREGIYLMNPGSIGMDYSLPYGSLDIQKGQLLPNVTHSTLP